MKEKLYSLGILIFPLTLPLPVELKYSSMAMIVFILISVLNTNKNLQFSSINKRVKWALLAFIAYFFIDILTGILYRSEFKFYDVKLPFLILPIVFVISSNFINKKKEILIKAFVIGQCLYFAYAILYITYFYLFLTNENFAFNGYLRYSLYNHLPGAIHHTYLGLNIILSIIFIEEYKIINNKYYKTILLLVFIIFSIALSAKIITLALIIYLLYKILKNKSKVVYSVLASISLILLALNYKPILGKLESSYSSRIEIWSCSLKIIGKNPLLGNGKNHVKQHMYSCNRSIGYNDAHNIWLQEWLSNGVLGLALLLFMFITLLRVDYANRLIIFFVGIILFAGLTEHIFNLQRGVMYFTFFSLLLLTNYFYILNTIDLDKNIRESRF